ncbi:1-phosphatidylinositol-4,5-bisphosphate phosphodiesterase 1 [Verticillium dahliae VDG2]|nr:1-phosphatidylinositol-4,5-bisphosphate phosphodiesterase 1 [Verticillium dahliae VDG2]
MSATRRARPRAPSEDPTDLPPYEPLELTLSDNVARSLNALAAGRDSRRYEEHIRKATTLLGRNVAAGNDRLAERQGDLQTILAKRAARGAEKTPADLRLEAWIAEFQAEVAALTAESEAAVRDLDLVIEGEIQSFICPLSLQPLTQPFSNNKCSHTFQKESIQAWFAEMRNQERTCPTTGCNVQLKLGDFYDDDLILRKILRQKKRLAAEAAAAEEIDDVSDDDEAPRRRSQAVKKERRGSDDEIEDDS